MKNIIKTAAMSLAMISSVTCAFAHANLEVKEAKINSSYKAVMRIAHGCDGQATTVVRITIPEGVIVAKPKPKAGWKLETITGDYAKTYEYHGPRSKGVKEIIWTGHLEDDHFDEFIFRARITDAFKPGETLYFPTVQDCVEGQNAWVEIPKADEHLKRPAPGLKLLEGDDHHH